MSIVTKHAEQRIKDRLGLSKRLSTKQSDEALEFGIRHNEMVGSLRKFVDKLFLDKHIDQHANNVRIYKQKIFLFNDQLLITILNLPYRYNNTIEKIKEKRSKI